MRAKSIEAALPASDFQRAKAWYTETLGLKPAEEGSAWYQIDGTGFLLCHLIASSSSTLCAPISGHAKMERTIWIGEGRERDDLAKGPMAAVRERYRGTDDGHRASSRG
jgi:catechol 2,3-dioxygenase-like lactoylglutathione lyase family enzyme